MEPQTARDICLVHAANLLHRKGYQCVDGLRIFEIIKQLQQLGDTHISDKCGLTLEVMEFIHNLEKQHLFYHMSSSCSQHEKLLQLLKNIYTYITEYDYLTLMIQLSHLPQKSTSTIHTYCRYYFNTWIDVFSVLLIDIHGQHAARMANNVVLMMIGVNTLNRINGSLISKKMFMEMTTQFIQLSHQQSEC